MARLWITRLTKFETQVIAPSSRHAWFHTPWIVERDDPTHVTYNLSREPTEVDDGDAEVLRVEMEEGNGNFEGVMEDKVMDDILLPLPNNEDEKQQVISNIWIVRNCLENPILQSWKLCR